MPHNLTRDELELAIDYLICVLDEIDAPEADLEADSEKDYEDEPSLASTNQIDQRNWSAGDYSDLEEDPCDNGEPDNAHMVPAYGVDQRFMLNPAIGYRLQKKVI